MRRKIIELYFGDGHHLSIRYIVRYKEHWWSRWHYLMDGRYPRLFTSEEIKAMKEE